MSGNTNRYCLANLNFFAYLPTMKLVKQFIDARDGSGSVTIIPEDPEDMVGRARFRYVAFIRKEGC